YYLCEMARSRALTAERRADVCAGWRAEIELCLPLLRLADVFVTREHAVAFWERGVGLLDQAVGIERDDEAGEDAAESARLWRERDAVALAVVRCGDAE